MQSKMLSDYVLSIRFDDLPQAAVETGKMCVEDLLGVALSASRRPEAKIWETYFLDDPRTPQSAVWKAGFACIGFREAAGLNAALGHMLDMDDVHNSSITHLGTVTIPAAIAVGQKRKSSGKQVLEAIVAGYEAGARIGEAINPGSYRYWHTTGIVGSFCSAAAAGKLLELNAGQMLNCFGSAGTQSAGLWEFLSDGAMSKPLHAANATLCGIRAAELSQLGLTGATKILEGERGLLRALTPVYDLDALTRGMDHHRYRILSNSFKPYACCRHTHSADYCVRRIMDKYAIDPEKIVSILDRTYQVAKDTTDNPQPATPYACKFSLQYCIAAAFLYRSLLDDVFTPEKMENPAVLRLMRKISVQVDPEIERAYGNERSRWPHMLEITMEDGRVICERVDYPPGDSKNPFTWKDTDEKFFQVTNGILTEKKANAILRRIRRLDELEDINDLFSE